MNRLLEYPDTLLSGAIGGAISGVMQSREPVFMAGRWTRGSKAQALARELLFPIFDREQLSIGVASRTAGSSLGEKIAGVRRRPTPAARHAGYELAQ